MENLNYLKKIISPELKKYNFKAKRAFEVNDIVFAGGKDLSIKFQKGQIFLATVSPSLEELFAIIYSFFDIDTHFHSAIINNDSITLVGYRCYDNNSNDYTDPSIDINDFGICLPNENKTLNSIESYNKDSKYKQKLVELINGGIQHFIRCNITKNDEINYLKDLEEYKRTTTNLI